MEDGSSYFSADSRVKKKENSTIQWMEFQVKVKVQKKDSPEIHSSYI